MKKKIQKHIKTYNGNTIGLGDFNDGQFVLNDGSLILIEDALKVQKFISVDVNGYGKKPNRLGRDLFMFQLMPNGELLPSGMSGTHFYNEHDVYCSKTSTNNMNGAGCTYKVLMNK